MTRFDQPRFKAQCFLEQLLMKGIQGQDITTEISEIKNIHGDNIYFGTLPTDVQVLKPIVKEQNPSNTREIVKIIAIEKTGY